MNKISFLITLALFLSLVSCGNNQSNSKTNNNAEVDNDSIQGIFFETPFGATKEEIITNFSKHGLSLDTYNSTDEVLHFDSKGSRYFSFGGFGWAKCRVMLNNNKLHCIDFYTPQKDKASSLNAYEAIENAVENKYHMLEVTPSDTTVYAKKRGYSKKQKRGVNITCYRYESVGMMIFFTAELTYYDENYESTSDEL